VNGFDEARRRVLEETLDAVVTVDISDDLVIESYAEIYETLRRHPKGSRTNVGENDMWIAAATRAAGATLLTIDGDFDSLYPNMIDRVYIPKNSRLAPPPSSP
jgi:predicted nucleic acid-binding protein